VRLQKKVFGAAALRQIRMKTISDVPIVWVKNKNLEKAIKILKLRLVAAGTLRQLKDRATCPRSSDRKKLKRHRSQRRRMKAEWQAAKRESKYF
jgi:ribosomal protein S21